MQPFNVELFDRDYNLIQHYNIEDIEYKFDYLSPVENNAYIPFNDAVKKGDYIRIVNNKFDYFGFITSIVIDEAAEGFCTIGFKPFIELFNANILFDIANQGTGYLENALAGYITDNWITNGDTSQNIAGLEVETISSTSSWTFYVSNDDGLDNEIVNFESIIQEALTKYQVGLYVTPNFTTQKIKIKIGRKSTSQFNIEADLPSVIKKNIIVNRNRTDINKLIVYDQSDLSSSIDYYLHPDGTYDTTDSDRITPVVYEMTSAAAPSGGTFADAAQEAADKQFGNIKDSNLIELTVLNDDDLVNAADIEIGTQVNIISNNVVYSSILTGYERKDTTKLIFGTIRVDLTKILKEALK